MIFDIGHDDLRRASCCAKAYTDDGTMSTSIRMETILFSEQQRGAIISPALIPALWARMFAMSATWSSFTGDPPPVPGNLPQRSVIIGVGHRPTSEAAFATQTPSSRSPAVPP